LQEIFLTRFFFYYLNFARKLRFEDTLPLRLSSRRHPSSTPAADFHFFTGAVPVMFSFRSSMQKNSCTFFSLPFYTGPGRHPLARESGTADLAADGDSRCIHAPREDTNAAG
jgi:hypothetical protein